MIIIIRKKFIYYIKIYGFNLQFLIDSIRFKNFGYNDSGSFDRISKQT